MDAVNDSSLHQTGTPSDMLSAQARRALLANTFALVLAGGRGTRLEGLTARRAKPAVPIAARHRIIDFTLSNCLNSGLACVGVLTQYMAQSLAPHLAAWSRLSRAMELLTLPAGAGRAYAGTADAVHQNRDLIRRLAPAQVLVLAADHVYRMDYARMLDEHLQRRAQVTVGCVEVPVESARSFGVMAIDDAGWIAGFAEKPDAPSAIPGRPAVALASMGIYVFETDFLLRLLRDDALRPHSARDFGRNVIPDALAATTRAYAHRLRDVHFPSRDGYWRDVGTVDAYWQTSLELCSDNPPWCLEDPQWPVHSLSIDRQEGSSVRADDDDGMADVRHSVLFAGVRLGAGTRLDRCIALPGVQIEAGCRVRNAIIDEGCRLPPGTEIGIDPAADRRRYPVTANGVVLVAR
ncbi:MAG: sugar phosphate nucleotidyltransferase [Pseudomonadota bacterium]|nr:sugar phosphate nucleotidyltransferase [Pseudomonadota bacterium]